MAQELGSPQMTALLETVPGIASVLRSPVADALVRTLRAAAGAGDFRVEDTYQLIQFAVRRGLIGGDEGDRLTAEMLEATSRSRAKTREPHRPVARKAVHKTAKRPTVKKPKASKKRRA